MSADDLEREGKSIVDKKIEERKADIAWFTQKANKVLEAQAGK